MLPGSSPKINKFYENSVLWHVEIHARHACVCVRERERERERKREREREGERERERERERIQGTLKREI